MVKVHIQQLPNCVGLPQRMRAGDAAADLTSAEAVTIEPQQRSPVRTGIALAIPPGWCGLVLPRSGLSLKRGVTVLNSPGLIDSGYRGEIIVILHNTGADPVKINAGDRIAQLLVVEAPTISFVETDVLPEAPDDRGSAGFGSSGS